MANDPRLFTVKPCYKADLQRGADVGKKKSFLDNITKFGDLEILNDTGGGDIGKGLRVLAAVSDSVRVGDSAVPGRKGTEVYNTALGKVVGTAIGAVSEGTEIVLDAVGLGGAVETVGQTNIGVANRAYEQGSQIWDRVKRGEFDITDIPEVFADLQNLETLVRGIFPGISGSESTKSRELCGATPYAMDLIAFAPKFQFMFIVEISYSTPYKEWNENAREVAFVIKTSTRPRFSVDYEDVNMYGFRTRVTRRIEYQPMEMGFYDDNKNAAHKFYVSYMRAMSPIANWKNKAPQDGQYEENGMNYYNKPASAATFTSTSSGTLGHSASSGPLYGNATSIIREIKLHHVFDYGNKMNTYNFYNPRITQFTPSDLTMAESGEGCDYSFEFAYDGLYIDHMIDLSKGIDILKNLTDQGIRPIDPTYASDATGLSDGPGEGEPDSKQSEDDAPTTVFLNGTGEGLSTASNGTTDTFGNVIGGVTNPAGELSNGINKIIANPSASLANLSKNISGAINQGIGAAQRAIGGLGDTISNGFKSSDTLAQQSKAINNSFNNTPASETSKKLFT